jgi:hypothetical protein
MTTRRMVHGMCPLRASDAVYAWRLFGCLGLYGFILANIAYCSSKSVDRVHFCSFQVNYVAKIASFYSCLEAVLCCAVIVCIFVFQNLMNGAWILYLNCLTLSYSHSVTTSFFV